MARNKYPEVTQEKILDAAKRLFLTKGYEKHHHSGHCG